jgi:hypothetical protein
MPIITAGEGQAVIEIWPSQGRVQCASRGCNFRARVILVRVAAEGVFGSQTHLCLKHTRGLVAQAKADGNAIVIGAA